MRTIYLLVLFALLLQGCGHKGPLVLPEKAPPDVHNQAPAQEKHP